MSQFRPSDANDIKEKECLGLDTALSNKLLSFDFSTLQKGTERMAGHSSRSNTIALQRNV